MAFVFMGGFAVGVAEALLDGAGKIGDVDGVRHRHTRRRRHNAEWFQSARRIISASRMPRARRR